MKKFLTHDLLMLIAVASLLTVFSVVFAQPVEPSQEFPKMQNVKPSESDEAKFVARN